MDTNENRPATKGRTPARADILVPGIGILFCLSGFLLLHEGFLHNTQSLGHELFAAALASVFTVSCMAMLMRSQARQERDRVFHSHVFQSKLRIYEKLLELIFGMDDDGIITQLEIKTVENHAGSAALVAGQELVCTLAQFVLQLKLYGRIYFRNMDAEQVETFVGSLNRTAASPGVGSTRGIQTNYLCPTKRALCATGPPLDESHAEPCFVSLDDVVQAMREDLSIVTGNVRDVLAAFILVPFDQHGLMRTPNMAH